MLLGEMQDLARQVAERTVPRPLWLAAVRSAISQAGAYDDRLEEYDEENVVLLAGAKSVTLPPGRSAGELLSVSVEKADGERTRLLRWKGQDARLEGEEMTWDTPDAGEIVFYPTAKESTNLVLLFRRVPQNDTDEVPDYLLFGALAWLGGNLFQDTRTEQWAAQFQADLEAAVARGITATSHPIRLRG